MATFIVLVNLTEQGVRDIKDAPARIAESAQAIEAAGGKLSAIYMTMGAYDYVAVVDGLSDEDALANLLN